MGFSKQIITLYCVFCLSVACLHADTGGLLHDVDQLVRVRSEMHRERIEWEAQQEALRNRIQLLKRERELLKTRITETEVVADEESEEWVALEQRRTRQEAAIRDAARALDRMDRQLPDVHKRVPDALRAELNPAGPARTFTDRLRNTLALAADMHRLDQAIHSHRQLIDTPADGRLQMDVIYLGLAQAYAVSRDDRIAGHGVWNGEDWIWTWNPAWAGALRQAVRIVEGEQPPRWLNLPLVIVGEEQP